MTKIPAYAAIRAKNPLEPFSIDRREPGPHDVAVDILFCGVCHSDIHQVRDDWGGALFPMVPGHEIVGKVRKVGMSVTRFKVGDSVGIGCFVDSCRACSPCKDGEEQYCEKGMSATYNGREQDGKTPTFGGYSTHIVADENHVLRISDKLPLEKTATLLCAGITTYSPLKHWGAGPDKKVAVVGLGGLGHMAVKFAAAMGAETTVLSSSDRKREDSLRLGAKHYVNTAAPGAFEKNARSFDLIINTISAEHDPNGYLNLLKRDGTMVILGVPEKPGTVHPFSLIMGRRSLAGSLIGGIRETQEMLDFCAKTGVVSDVEVIPIQKINEAYERMNKGDVRYRFVIDVASLK